MYFAGLFDGEGCIDIWAGRHGAAKSPNHQLRCTIAMTDKDVLDRFQCEYGGVVKRDTIRLNRKPMYRAVLVSTNAGLFLRRIMPYSLVKSQQVWLGLEFLAQRTETRTKKLGTPPEEVALREGFRLALQEAKRG